jgi:protein-disulfide isomerase/uncharacterized membrane protein
VKRFTALSVLRLAAISAMGFSVALIVDATRAVPAFCASGSGCDVVRKSGYSSLGGVPVSYMGLLAFAVLFVMAMSHASRRRLAAWASILGGVVALGLLCLQAFVIHAFCTLCLGVDLSALVAAGAGLSLLREKSPKPKAELLPGASWAALVLAALFGPIAAGTMVPATSAPADIRAFWQPGVVNIVELSDFECPFCRINHPALEKALQEAKQPVHFVRVSMPLSIHEHARDATRAYLCSVQQDKGDAMADALFKLDPPSAEKALAVAGELKLDLDRYQACLVDPKTEERIAADTALVRRTDFKGLPTTWVNDQKLLGAKPASEISEAIAAAAAGQATGRGPGLFVSFLVAVGLMFGFGMRHGLPPIPVPAPSSSRGGTPKPTPVPTPKPTPVPTPKPARLDEPGDGGES